MDIKSTLAAYSYSSYLDNKDSFWKSLKVEIEAILSITTADKDHDKYLKVCDEIITALQENGHEIIMIDYNGSSYYYGTFDKNTNQLCFMIGFGKEKTRLL